MNLEEYEDMLNLKQGLLNPDFHNEKTLKDNWTNYCCNINNSINTMWNFVLYNQFNNEEIRNLQTHVNRFNQENIKLKKKTKFLQLDLEIQDTNNKKLKRKLDEISDKDSDKAIVKRPNLLKNEYDLLTDKEQTILEYDITDDTNIKLLNVFKNINSISDIIKLKDSKYKFYFVQNEKFNKLYNLIPALEELDSIIGMNEVKDTIYNSICYFLHGLNNSKELNHVMITGPPGVGKTTVAKIIGNIYVHLDFLENNKFIVARRSDLIGKYLGHTAVKTQEVIDKAQGGVLFIDEVYSLGNPDNKDSFSKECIDTINLNMTEAKKPWLLIVGGYKEDIESSFLSYNRGLERRFTVRLNIDSYSSNELYLILLKFIKDDNWIIEDNSVNIETIDNNIKYFKFFAGDMQKIFQKAKHYYSIRLMKTSIDFVHNKLLTKDDFDKSIYDLVSKLSNKDELENSVTHTMYI